MKWEYFEKFKPVNDKYLPAYGEGDNMATQIVTAVNKLIYKWYNDGDVFDNSYCLAGWANDLSSYANWLHEHTTEECASILESVWECMNDEDYENMLVLLADYMLDCAFLEQYENQPKTGSIYECDGPFEFLELNEEDDEDWEYEEEEMWEDDEDDDY